MSHSVMILIWGSISKEVIRIKAKIESFLGPLLTQEIDSVLRIKIFPIFFVCKHGSSNLQLRRMVLFFKSNYLFYVLSLFIHNISFHFSSVASLPQMPNDGLIWMILCVARFPSKVGLIRLFKMIHISVLAIVSGI